MYVCARACVHLCVCVFEYRHAHTCHTWGSLRCQFLLSTLVETGSLVPTMYVRLAGPWDSGGFFCLSILPQKHWAHRSLRCLALFGYWDLNSTSHAFVESMLPTDPTSYSFCGSSLDPDSIKNKNIFTTQKNVIQHSSKLRSEIRRKKIYLQILEFRYKNCQAISDTYQAIFQTKYKETYKN